MKKLILSLMATLMFICSGIAFAACGDGGSNASQVCQHTNVSENVVAATCTEKGQKSKNCLDCQYVFPVEELPALGHDFGESEEFEATCTSAKIVAKQCGRCGDVVEETIGEALGHNFQLVSETPATCIAPAKNNYECDRDGCIAKKSETVEGSVALEHNYVHIADKDVKPTCTEAGEEFFECDREGCEDAYSNVLPPLEHSPEGEGTVVAPTCTEKGYTLMHCTRAECEQDYKVHLVPELGHQIVDGSAITASCDTMGYDTKVCQRIDCDYEERSNVVANTEHVFDSNGVCSGCGKDAKNAFALVCADSPIYSIEKVGSEYIVYAPSYVLYTKVMMPASILQALYAQGVYSFNIQLGSRKDSETKAMAFNIQGGQDTNINVLSNEMKEIASYTFADKNGIFDKDQDGILFGVYYRVMDEMNAAIGESKVSSYAISFQYNPEFNVEDIDTYFKTALSYTCDDSTFTFTNVNTSGNNTILVRKELLQYYYDQGYRTIDITVSNAIGQHFAKNMTVSAQGMETVTTGNTNDISATLRGIELESILSGDLRLDIYCVDNYGTAWNPDEPMDCFLLSFKLKQPGDEPASGPVTAFTSGNGFITDVLDSVPVTASEPVYEGDTAAITYTMNVVNHTYTFINFDATLINEMMANGYINVTFKIALPSARYISADLNGTGLETITKQFGGVANVEFDEFALTADGTYNIRFFFGEVTDVTVTAIFEKPVTEPEPTAEPVTAFTSGNGQIADVLESVSVTAGEPVYAENTATITYTLNIVNHTYTFLNFDAVLVNEMMAQGYTSVTFNISLPSARYINADLNGTGLETVTKQFGGVANVEFDEFALTADGTYNIRFFFGEVTDVTVTAIFEKPVTEPEPTAEPVTAFTSGNGQIADILDSVPVIAGEPVYEGDTATITYGMSVQNHTYTFINFDATLINEMMAQGYTSITFNVTLPSARYIASTLNGTGIAAAIDKTYGAVANVSFEDIALTADGTYNIRFYFGDVTDVTIAVVFTKPAPAVTAFTSGNGLITDVLDSIPVTAGEPVYEGDTATITYGMSVQNHTYTFINFDATLINEMMAQGYTKVTFNVALPSARYIASTLNGTGIAAIDKTYGAVANVSFEDIALTADGTYNIRFYFGDVTETTVTVVFSK